MLRLFLAVWLAKFIQFLTRTLNLGGGSAAPGLYALKIEPNLIKKLSPQIPTNIIIAGTNGKTTTSRMLAHFASTSNLKVIRNATGSNLERGIASALIARINPWTLKLKQADIGIWELDEAAFNKVVPSLNPNIMVFLNVFRDQLDRYGEVDSVVKKWEQTLEKLSLPDSLILVNGDDPNTLKLREVFKGKSETFGIPELNVKSEAKGKKESNLDFRADDIKQSSLDNVTFQVNYPGEKMSVLLPMPGTYHVYDFLAAFVAGYHLNLDPEKMIDSIDHFMPAFGRVEKLIIKKKAVYLFLIKNPEGASQVFSTISDDLKTEDMVVIGLNDNFADGKDVSWIWDANFEIFAKSPTNFIATGTRAEEIAIRLKYAGVNKDKIEVKKSLESTLEQVVSSPLGRVFIMPTYTTMLELQSILAKKSYKKTYWKEEG